MKSHCLLLLFVSEVLASFSTLQEDRWWSRTPQQCNFTTAAEIEGSSTCFAAEKYKARQQLSPVLPFLSEVEIKKYKDKLFPNSAVTLPPPTTTAQTLRPVGDIRVPLRSMTSVIANSGSVWRERSRERLRAPCACISQEYFGELTTAESAFTETQVQIYQPTSGASQVFHVVFCTASHWYCHCKAKKRIQNALIVGANNQPEHGMIWVGACCEDNLSSLG